MESKLDETIKELMSNRGVIGVVCADRNGLCLAQSGRPNAAQAPSSAEDAVKAAAAIATIARQASKLEPETSKAPVLVIEGENMNIMIRSHFEDDDDDNDNVVTTALYKATSGSLSKK